LRLDGESGSTRISRGRRQESGQHLMVVPLPTRFEPSKPNASLPLGVSVGGSTAANAPKRQIRTTI
jgi:hypothetical protein